MRAFVTAEFTTEGVARLGALGFDVVTGGWGATRQELAAEDYVTAARGADVLVTEIERVDAAVLDALPTVRFVATARGEPVNVDLAACAARGIPVVHTPGRNAESVADFTVGLILSLCRQISAAERHLRQSGWYAGPPGRRELPYLHFRGPELAGRTLGLVGYGAVGRAVARRACQGFGMRVIYTDPYQPGSVPLPDLLATADIVSLHCALTPETVGLLGVAELSLMQPTAYLVNTARAACVDEVALIAALREHRIAGAALDVFWTEPLPPEHPLLELEGVVLTPHLAGAAYDVVRHHTDVIVAAIERWMG